MKKKLTLGSNRVEVEADVLKTSPLAVHKASGKGYLVTHATKSAVVLWARTKQLAQCARRELAELDWDDPASYEGPVRAAQARYLKL